MFLLSHLRTHVTSVQCRYSTEWHITHNNGQDASSTQPWPAVILTTHTNMSAAKITAKPNARKIVVTHWTRLKNVTIIFLSMLRQRYLGIRTAYTAVTTKSSPQKSPLKDLFFLREWWDRAQSAGSVHLTEIHRDETNWRESSASSVARLEAQVSFQRCRQRQVLHILTVEVLPDHKTTQTLQVQHQRNLVQTNPGHLATQPSHVQRSPSDAVLRSGNLLVW